MARKAAQDPLEERLDYLINMSKGTLVMEVWFEDADELARAQTYLKGKRNTKSLTLRVKP